MLKKIFVYLLTFLMFTFTNLPVLALDEFEYEDETNYKHTVNVEFVDNLNVNETPKHAVVQFVSTEDYKGADGIFIPKGTTFKGHVHGIKHSRWAYRRAKIRIIVNEMTYPSGETYKIKAITKRHVLKGSALKNIAKGIVVTPPALAVTVAGSAIMFVEAVTIVGLAIVVPTGTVVGGVVGKMTNGVNCKKNAGDDIQLKIKYVKP